MNTPSFYEKIKNIDDVTEFEILKEDADGVAGKFKYKDQNVIFGFIDARASKSGINVFTSILKISFNIDIKGKNKSEFNKKLNDFVNNDLKDIPTVLIKHSYKSNEVTFDIINQIPYRKKIQDSIDIIEPMLELLSISRIRIISFILQYKKDNIEG